MSAEFSGKVAVGRSVAEYAQGQQDTATDRPDGETRRGIDEASFLEEDIAALDVENPGWHDAYHVNGAVTAFEMRMPYDVVVNLYGQAAADAAAAQTAVASDD